MCGVIVNVDTNNKSHQGWIMFCYSKNQNGFVVTRHDMYKLVILQPSIEDIYLENLLRYNSGKGRVGNSMQLWVLPRIETFQDHKENYLYQNNVFTALFYI